MKTLLHLSNRNEKQRLTQNFFYRIIEILPSCLKTKLGPDRPTSRAVRRKDAFRVKLVTLASV